MLDRAQKKINLGTETGSVGYWTRIRSVILKTGALPAVRWKSMLYVSRPCFLLNVMVVVIDSLDLSQGCCDSIVTIMPFT